MANDVNRVVSNFEFLTSRRSVKARTMEMPGPDKETLGKIITAGMHVPDHGKLTPWRFIVLEGSEREAFGALIKKSLIEEDETDEFTASKMQSYATQGPTLVITIYSPSNAKSIPKWEQKLSVGGVCMNMLNAAHALGIAGQWLTGWASYSPAVSKGLGLTEDEKIAGLLFFGTLPENKTPARARPSLEDKVIWGFPHVSGGVSS